MDPLTIAIGLAMLTDIGARSTEEVETNMSNYMTDYSDHAAASANALYAAQRGFNMPTTYETTEVVLRDPTIGDRVGGFIGDVINEIDKFAGNSLMGTSMADKPKKTVRSVRKNIQYEKPKHIKH